MVLVDGRVVLLALDFAHCDHIRENEIYIYICIYVELGLMFFQI